MLAKRLAIAVCLAAALGGGVSLGQSVFYPSIDMCQAESVKNSAFWSWWYGCSPDYPAVNEPAP